VWVVSSRKVLWEIVCDFVVVSLISDLDVFL